MTTTREKLQGVFLAVIMVLSVFAMNATLVGTALAATNQGELTFTDQPLGSDGTVTVENVSTGQPSTVVVTYTDGENETVAGFTSADNLNNEDVSVLIENTGGFPGDHTAWVFNDTDVPEGLSVGDDATPIAGSALDSQTANVFQASGSLTFNDQELAQDGTVTVENVSTGQNSTIVVTYAGQNANGDTDEIVAGLAAADNLDNQDVSVLIEDTGGFPGEHTAWVFDDSTLRGISLSPGDGVIANTPFSSASDVQNAALDFGSAQVSEAPTGSLTFTEQPLASDGTVTVENVSTGQPSTVVVTYTDGDNETVAGFTSADNLDNEDVSVLIEDADGFPGDHTAWVFDDADVPGDLSVGDDATPIAGSALDSQEANVFQSSGSLTFNDQELANGQVTVENVTTDQASTVVVTYTDQEASEEVIAGLAAADNLDNQDVPVTIEDTGGFPGEHTAWVFADVDVPSGVGISDDATPIAGNALDSANAQVSAPPTGELTFTDQPLAADGTVTVENVSTGQNSTVVVTYTDQEAGEEVIAGLAAANGLDNQDVSVSIENTGGFPGEHTAWVFDDADVPDGVGIGDDATPIADSALDSQTANVFQSSGSLSFSEQPLAADGTVTVEDVTTDQASTVVVTYTDEQSGEEVIAGLAAADNLDGQDVSVSIDDAGGFPGNHTAWVFADVDVPSGVGIGDDARPIASAALDSQEANVFQSSGSLTFSEQSLADDGTVTVENVSTGQPSTVVVTYTDGTNETIAGIASADNLNNQDVSVFIEDTGGFPGEHTAWVFADVDVPSGVGIGDDATPIAGNALDSQTANVFETAGELSFDSQKLADDGTVLVENVSTNQASTVVVTYTDQEAGEEVIAGLAAADNLDGQDVPVTIEDTGGFPGEHTAWVFADSTLPDGIGIGDDATPVAESALDSESAVVDDPDAPVYYVDIQNDGGTYTVGFPGTIATEAVLGEMFVDDEGYQLYAYDNDDNSWVPLTGDDLAETPDELDAVVVATDGNAGPEEITVRIPLEVTDRGGVAERSVDSGWNFIASPSFSDAENAFEGTAGATAVQDRYTAGNARLSAAVPIAQPGSFVDQTGQNSYAGDGSVPEVDPFKGYFVFYDSDGQVPVLAGGVEDSDDADETLGVEEEGT